MHIEFLLEEYSAKAALEHLLPRIVGPQVTHRFIVHQGKRDLLTSLPILLRGYRQWIPADYRIVVLLDEDREDCHALKANIEQVALQAGLPTKTSPDARGGFRVLNRIAIEELEAWFFGDAAAIAAAYPRVSRNLGRSARYRNPDAIAGGTWEALERVLRRAGYWKRAGMRKVEAADRIATFMDPDRNISRSFQVFRDAMRAIAV